MINFKEIQCQESINDFNNLVNIQVIIVIKYSLDLYQSYNTASYLIIMILELNSHSS